MTAVKTNERPGTRSQARNVRMSATKARAVLDLVRGKSVDEAQSVLAFTERRAAEVVGKCLGSAVANAEHNDEIDPQTLYISACYADEGRTMYRWRPRARGRATRIRKRTCHITVIVSPMPAEMLAREQAKREAIPGSRAARRRGQESASRARRVAKSQEAAESAEDAGIVDQDAEAVATADQTAAGEGVAPQVEESELTESLEEEGIVDQNAEAAVRADEATDTAEADEASAGSGSVQRDSEDSEADEGDPKASERSASEADEASAGSGSVQRDSEDSEADEGDPKASERSASEADEASAGSGSVQRDSEDSEADEESN
jgi:large subunit ribosomal protein L22